jgi:hypothetical protein
MEIQVMDSQQNFDSDFEDYKKQTETNEAILLDIMKSVRPDIFQLLSELNRTKIQPIILTKVVRQLDDIATGLQYGEVKIQIENGQVTFIRGEASDKVYLPLIETKNQ